MKIKGAIFDMDGTLLNSMDYWATVANDYLVSVGITPDLGANRRFLETGMKSFYEYYRDNFGLSGSFDELNDNINNLMRNNYQNYVVVKDGAREMLDKLYNNGVKMCLATATDRSLVVEILKKLDIEKYFSRIFTTREVGKGKAFPLIYEVALEYLGTPKNETFIFEDAFYAIKTAHDNNFKVVGVYDKNAFVPKETMSALCDYYIDENDKYNIDMLL